MNNGFIKIISANADDRRDLFLSTANRIGTPIQNIEKDFWVTWIVDLLFNGRAQGEPRLLFKGGTSLSKAYGLISRFSEDIDITVFREDIGHSFVISDLEGLSGKKQRVLLDAIRDACQHYINETLKNTLNAQIMKIFQEADILVIEPPVESDPSDPDKQSLLFRYPSVVNIDTDAHYIKPMVKIEAGAKSALDPHCLTTIKPYIENELPNLDLTVQNITTIEPDRTFWDKVVILHGVRRWFDNRRVLRQQGHRVSRHYYDVYKLFHSPVGKRGVMNQALAIDCAKHAKMFFNSNDLDLINAVPGSLSLLPTHEMAEILKKDYDAMAGMIFGDIPNFSEVLKTISHLENELNNVTSLSTA